MNEYQKRFIHKVKPDLSDREVISEQLSELVKEHKLLCDIWGNDNKNKFSKK